MFRRSLGASAALHALALVGLSASVVTVVGAARRGPSPDVRVERAVPVEPRAVRLPERLEVEPVDVPEPDLVQRHVARPPREEEPVLEPLPDLDAFWARAPLVVLPGHAAADPEPDAVQEPVPAPSAQPEVRSSGASEPVLVEAPAPRYPAASVRLGEEGVVLCRIHVARDGRVLRVDVLQSTGFARLDRAAIEAIHGWSLRPGLLAGEAIESSFVHAVEFRLTDA